MFFLALSPLIVFVFLFIFFQKVRLIFISLTAFLLTFVLVLVFWQTETNIVLASILKGLMVAFDILIIIFGAILFLECLNKAGIISSLCSRLEKYSKDYRVQVILLAWFFENFLEGTAGFGTPSTVVAPILVSVGLTPLTAVAVSLLGNSASVVFGAAGTPIRLGFSDINVSEVTLISSLFNFIGFLVPVFMLYVITRGRKQANRQFLEALPLAILAGIAFVVPSFFFAFLGPELPSILGSVVGILIVILAIKLNFLVPKTTQILRQDNLKEEKMSFLKVFSPYISLVFLLLVGKFVIGTKGIDFYFGLSHKFNYFNPGFAFIISATLVLLLFKEGFKSSIQTVKRSLSRSIEPFLVVALMSAMAQLMIHSNHNSIGLESMLGTVTNSLVNPLLPLITPFVGAFGTFLTGSVTVSNIMFGELIKNASTQIGANLSIILSLLLVGGAAGNMISLADIIPALVVVKQGGKERQIIKRVIVPCLIYVFLVGLAGLFVVNYLKD